MKLNLEKYQNFIFDCDGVLIDSNKIKGDVFVKIAHHFSPTHAAAFEQFHAANGGLNRREKFTFFFREIMGRADFDKELEEALVLFREQSINDLKQAERVPGIESFLKSIPATARKYVISAGDHNDLSLVLKEKKLDHYFDGLFGGPKKKTEIMAELALTGNTVFFGDSEIDYKAAMTAGTDFVFVSGFCSWPNWTAVLKPIGCLIIRDFTEI